MVARTRTRTFTLKGGSATPRVNGLSPDLQGLVTIASESCDDVIGNRSGANYFFCENRYNLLGVANGDVSWAYRCKDWIVTTNGGGYIPAVTTEPSDASAVSTALKNSNPSQPVVDMPILIAELRELPKLVQLAGNSILKKGASATLSWEFGWKPLIGDLRKMLDFNAHVERRMKHLDRLYSQQGLRRKITVWEDEALGPQFQVYCGPLYQNNALAYFRFKTVRKKWVTVQYRPSTKPPYSDSAGQRKLAEDLVFGRNLSISQAWELIPWSWLIDWFSNVGDILAANRNHLATTATNVCIMRSATTTAIYAGKNTSTNVWSFSPNMGGRGWTQRRRTVGSNSPAIDVYLPFLDGRQLSILSALAILKKR